MSPSQREAMLTERRLIGGVALALIVAMALIALPHYTPYRTPVIALDVCLLAASVGLTSYLVRRHDRGARVYAASVRVTVSMATSLFCCIVFVKDMALQVLT